MFGLKVADASVPASGTRVWGSTGAVGGTGGSVPGGTGGRVGSIGGGYAGYGNGAGGQSGGRMSRRGGWPRRAGVTSGSGSAAVTVAANTAVATHAQCSRPMARPPGDNAPTHVFLVRHNPPTRVNPFHPSNRRDRQFERLSPEIGKDGINPAPPTGAASRLFDFHDHLVGAGIGRVGK